MGNSRRLVAGLAIGYLGGNTGTGVALGIAAGAVAAGAWHYVATRA
ncbi:hypothetical protein [Stappia sp. P2PMeth1]|nr:hypothetical protein [Stappia sp. P2PMeth1]